MKELQPKVTDQTEIHAQAEKRKELKKIGSIRLQRGQKLYELNTADNTIREAEYESISKIGENGKVTTERKLHVKEGHLYAAAINPRNADKKFVERLTGLTYKQYLAKLGLTTK